MRVVAGEAIRSVCFDVENRPSAYWWDGKTTAELTAIAWKWHDEPDVHTLLLGRDGRWSHDEHRRRLTVAAALDVFRGVLTGAGIVYGHNIRRHDLPIFQAALERLSLPVLPALLTSDTLADYPKRKDKSASLENLAVELGLDDAKVHMGVADWEEANRLTPEGVAATRVRVTGDVILQEKLRDRLLELGYLTGPHRWRPTR